MITSLDRHCKEYISNKYAFRLYQTNNERCEFDAPFSCCDIAVGKPGQIKDARRDMNDLWSKEENLVHAETLPGIAVQLHRSNVIPTCQSTLKEPYIAERGY